MKQAVLLDIDGVIANFCYEFSRFLNDNYKCHLPLEHDPDNYNFSDWGHGTEFVNTTQASKIWMETGGFRRIPIFKGAKEFVKKIHKNNNVFIVTARVGEWEDTPDKYISNIIKKETLDWLKDYSIPYYSLVFTHKKIDFCIKNNIHIMFEDKLTTAIDASQNNIHTILLNKNYNQALPIPLIHRVNNFNEAFNKLLILNDTI